MGMPVMLTPEQAARSHPMPAITASKVHRLRVLAAEPDPKIRESVASSLNAPHDLYRTLSSDPDEGVRGCVARNTAAPVDVLRSMLGDPSEQVRGWLVVNRSSPPDVVAALSDDSSATVAQLIRWRVGQTA